MRRYGAGRFAAALPLAHGSPLCGGAPARARLSASVRRSRSRSVRRFGAALSLALGSPLWSCGAPARARFAAWGGAPAHARLAASVRLSVLRRSRSRTVRRLGRRSRSRPARRLWRRFPAAEKALCATFWAALSLAPGSPLWAALPLTLGFPLRAALSLRSVRRFGVALPLALGSPCCCGAPARARFAALRRSRSARLAALRLRRSRSRSGGFYLINIYLNIIINQSRRRREAPAFRTAKKYAPFGGVFPLSDIYFCFAYSAIALYFSKSSGRRMRALAGLVEGSSMHGMQPQGSQNRL